jgi:hypothetical protein
LWSVLTAIVELLAPNLLILYSFFNFLRRLNDAAFRVNPLLHRGSGVVQSARSGSISPQLQKKKHLMQSSVKEGVQCSVNKQKLLINSYMSTRSSAVAPSQSAASEAHGGALAKDTQLMEAAKSLYPADRLVQFLHLHAEVDTLLLELRTLKQQRPVPSPVED